MATEKKIVFRDEEEAANRLSRKAKESPFMLVGKYNLWNKIIDNFSKKFDCATSKV